MEALLLVYFERAGKLEWGVLCLVQFVACMVEQAEPSARRLLFTC